MKSFLHIDILCNVQFSRFFLVPAYTCFHPIVNFCLSAIVLILQTLSECVLFCIIFSAGKDTIPCVFVPVLFEVRGVMHLPLYPLLPSSCLPAKNSEHTFHMHSWLSLRNMERLQQPFCLTELGHWWDGWLPLSRRHQQPLPSIFIHLQDPPLCCYACVCLCVHAFICAHQICMLCVFSASV